jgi:MFS family permease
VPVSPRAGLAPAAAGFARLLAGQLVPRPRTGRQLAGIALLDATGSGMYFTGSALYFTQVVGLTAGQVGVGWSVGGLVGLLGSVPVGILADRVRAGRVYVGLQVLRGACFTAYCLVSSFAPFVAVAALAGLTETALPAVHQAVVGATVPAADRVDTLAKVRAVRNVGFGLGASVAVWAIGRGSRAAFLLLIGGNAASYFVVALLLALTGIGSVAVRVEAARRPVLRLVADVRYVAAAGLSGILAVHATLLVVAVPLWFARHTLTPPPVVGVLIVVNTVLAVLLQARFARPCASVPGALRAARWAGLALAGFAVASQLAHATRTVGAAVALALVAAVLLTFAELWQSASGWTLSYELADPARRTAYLSTFQLGTSLQAVAGPWLITTVLFPARAGWLVFGAIAVVAGVLVGVVLEPDRRARSGA